LKNNENYLNIGHGIFREYPWSAIEPFENTTSWTRNKVAYDALNKGRYQDSYFDLI